MLLCILSTRLSSRLALLRAKSLLCTVRQVVSACHAVSEHFTYFLCKYVKSHFSGRVNGLSKVHYFFTEVDRMTKHIVIREIPYNKTRELTRVVDAALIAPTRRLTFATTN